ncbi:MAG: helix-turn-helix domain-containing protein, partial [Myxococcota bacterium]
VVLADLPVQRDLRPSRPPDPTEPSPTFLPRLSFRHEDGRRLTLRELRDLAERQVILSALDEFDWNVSRAATALGVERTNLHKKIKALGIRRGETPEG